MLVHTDKFGDQLYYVSGFMNPWLIYSESVLQESYRTVEGALCDMFGRNWQKNEQAREIFEAFTGFVPT